MFVAPALSLHFFDHLKAQTRVPVVVVTTSARPRDADCCYQCGANAHHVEPFSYPQHLQRLMELLKYWLVQVLRPTAQRLAP